jgi:hypothetical protein
MSNLAKHAVNSIRRLERFIPSGPHRGLKLIGCALVFLIPGGSLALLAMSWCQQRRASHG